VPKDLAVVLNGKRAGSFGDADITSFFPAKPLGCYGDGGAIFTDDSELASLLESFKVHGKGSYKYENVRIGVNSRLDTIQANLGTDTSAEGRAVSRAVLEAFTVAWGVERAPSSPTWSSESRKGLTLTRRSELRSLPARLKGSGAADESYF